MAVKTISTTITNSVTLGTGRYGGLLTITSGGEIIVPGVGVDIPVAETSGLVINDGSIISKGIGVELAAGSLTNAGYIAAQADGALLYGGSLTNGGRISSTSYGISAAGSSITNLATATISGATVGVGLHSGASLTNDGTISAVLYGLKLSGGASAENYGTIISSSTAGPTAFGAGVYMPGGVLTNDGSVYGRNIGIFFFGGSLDNAGTVAAGLGEGVVVQGGTFTNAGFVYAQGTAAALLMQGGIAENSGDIAGSVGIQIAGGFVSNAGDVLSGGVYLTKSFIKASFVNYGVVNGVVYVPGASRLAAVVEQQGVVFNVVGGLISGTYDGAAAMTGTYLYNAGTIVGANSGLLASESRIINAARATISGEVGVTMSYSTLMNFGSIYGTVSGLQVTGTGIEDNLGAISGGTFGVQAYSTRSLDNYGSISGEIGVLLEGRMTNAGDISGQTYGVEAINPRGGDSFPPDTLHNSGSIFGGAGGVDLISGSVTNSGEISGTEYGVVLKDGMLENAGNIYGGKFGVAVFGGLLTDSGTIAGGKDAVYGIFVTLTVNPGAVFLGDVVNAAGKSLLALGGTAPGTLSGIGSAIIGFSEISFATGSEWTLAGNAAGLAAGQEIAGFTLGDTIVLDGFGARSDSYVNGVGLVLAIGGKTETLAIAGSFYTGDFIVTAYQGHTTIAAAPPGKNTISGSLTKPVTLDSGGYGSPLTITSTGVINTRSVGVVIPQGNLINDGSIYGATYGVSIASGSLTNAGSIAGGKDAVFGRSIFLTVDPGAVFAGNVIDTGGAGSLELAGSVAATLAGIGSAFSGFSEISFAAGSEWTLEGNEAGLAAGQQINGFSQGDAIVLDGFAATSDTYVTGVGLVLSNGSSTKTLDITGNFHTGDFVVGNAQGNSTISPSLTLDRTISSTIIGSVRLGTGNYLSPLTITNTGEVNGAKTATGDAVIVPVNVTTGTVVNHGILLASMVEGNTGPSAIYMDSVNTLSAYNFGYIGGYRGIAAINGKLDNLGTIKGDNGVLISTATILNSGYIGGSGIGAEIGFGDVTNAATGTIKGGKSSDGIDLFGQYGSNSVINYGLITGEFGIEAGRNVVHITNAGTIAGSTDAIQAGVLYVTVEPGAVFTGDVTNYPHEHGTLTLAGTTAGSLAGIGTQFTGFRDIDFDSGSQWTIEGGKGGLASNQEINGFAAGDRIELDHFGATSDTYVSGLGLVISNGNAEETLRIMDNFTTSDFVVTRFQGNTTIALAATPLLELAVVPGPAMMRRSAAMGFVSPAAEAGGIALLDHSPASFLDLFSDIRDAAHAAGYAAQVVGVADRVSNAAVALAADGFGVAALGLGETQFIGKVAALPTFGSERIP